MGNITRVLTPTRVWVTFEQTVQLRDYEPAKVGVGMSDDVQEEETPKQAFKRIRGVLTSVMKEEADALRAAKKSNR